jgi:hypothetical protein
MKTILGIAQKMKTGLFSLSFCLIFLSFISCGKNGTTNTGTTGPANGNMVNYAGTFVNSGGNDSSKATGTVTATFNTSTLVLTYIINWKSLTSEPVQMHFHDNGPVIVKILGYPVATDGQVSGTCSLTSAQGGDLASGLLYAMIHTQNYSAGEIMAFLMKQ